MTRFFFSQMGDPEDLAVRLCLDFPLTLEMLTL